MNFFRFSTALVAFFLASTAEGHLQITTEYQCLGHFTMHIPKEIRGDLGQIRANYDLTEIRYSEHVEQSEFDELVQRRVSELSPKDQTGEVSREDLPSGTIISVGQTENGGKIYGAFFSDGAVFGTETRFSDRMRRQFRNLVAQLGGRLHPLKGSPPSRAVFCFEGGYIAGPVTTPTRAQVFHALLKGQDQIQLEIISEWLAAPEIGFSPDVDTVAGTPREVGGTEGVQFRFPPKATARDHGYVILPEASSETYYYEGVANSSPGLRLRLRLSDSAANSTDPHRDASVNAIWETLLSSISPLPNLGALP